MATTKTKKQGIYNDLIERKDSNKAILLISTDGAKKTMDAKTTQEFRSSAIAQGVKLQIVKNTIIAKTLGEKPKTGQTFLAYLEDASAEQNEVQMPKIMVKSVQKDFAEQVKVIGAIVNGSFISAEEAIALSKFPSKDESLAMMAGQIQQIISKIAVGVKEIPASVARGIQAAKK
jgi:large subunit ribosomal protein L10